ncbi:glycosyltransferase family 4 protein [Salinibacter ruber]|uniref:glycosyltransferase family 4 protein n=1 Tax=Salinibacter ruber TaxID=146919 RepID=UPI0021695711|nr:glycosyltransferase family 4 protein [Salinibacter ruber]MCS4223596.1 glycosyltransferase involved in cell wall biosynthesis [Salinibacter ruber]
MKDKVDLTFIAPVSKNPKAGQEVFASKLYQKCNHDRRIAVNVINVPNQKEYGHARRILYTLWVLYKIFKDRSYSSRQVIHIFTPCNLKGLLEKIVFDRCASILGFRTIMNFRNDISKAYKKWPSYIKLVLRVTFKNLDILLVQYNGLKTFLIDEIGCNSRQVFSIPNGIEFAEDNQNISSGSKLRILFLGDLIYRKGLDTVIKSIRYLPNDTKQRVRLVIAGEWKDISFKEKMLREIVKHRLEDVISFVGYISGENKKNILRSCDLFVLLSRSEGFPNALLEAAKYELCCITSTAGAMGEVAICDRNIVSPNDERGLSDIITFYAENKGAAKKCGREMATVVEQKYSFDRVFQMFKDLYQKISSGKI